MNDLDTAVRTMLLERAQDITEVPPGLALLDLGGTTPGTAPGRTAPDRSDPGGPSRGNVRHLRPAPHARHRGTWLIAASIAAVLAVGGIVTTLSLRGDDKDGTSPPPAVTRPHSASPTPMPSPTASHATVARPVTVRPTCRASAPSAWKDEFAAIRTFGADAATPLGFSGNDLVVTRDFGSSRDVALVAPGGTATSVYSVPDPDNQQVQSAAADGNYLLVPVSHAPRNANGVDPSIIRLDLVDLRTKQVTTVTTAPIVIKNGLQGRTIDGATIFRGKVYWNEQASYTSSTETIRSYDVATHATTTVTTHQETRGDGPAVRAGGLYWSQDDATPAIAATLPPQVSSALTTQRARGHLVTDGRAYAWSPDGNEIGYWAPGMAKATTFRVGGKSVFPDAVGGSVVTFEDVEGGSGNEQALDTRSSAVAEVGDEEPVAFAHDGILAIADSRTSATRYVDLVSLATLHC